MLIVGTRGRSLGGFQGLLPGSISKFCLQNSAVPVIVVRPGMQRSRGKKKRMNDPARSGYRDLLDRAGIDGHLLHESNRYSVDQLGGREEERPASSDESAAVAAAFGFRQPLGKVGSTPLTKVESAATDTTNNTDSEVGSEAEVARLNGLVSGNAGTASSAGGAVGGIVGAKVLPTASAPPTLSASAQRKAHAEQLAALGVELPEDLKREVTGVGGWQVVSERVVEDNDGHDDPFFEDVKGMHVKGHNGGRAAGSDGDSGSDSDGDGGFFER